MLRAHLIPIQFALGVFFFVDAATYSKSARNGSDVHIRFVDWIPSICSFLGMLVINSIDKARLSGDSYSYNGNGVAWKARLVLFFGFAMMAGGLAGAVVCASLWFHSPTTKADTVFRRLWCSSTWCQTMDSRCYGLVLPMWSRTR